MRNRKRRESEKTDRIGERSKGAEIKEIDTKERECKIKVEKDQNSYNGRR